MANDMLDYSENTAHAGTVRDRYRKLFENLVSQLLTRSPARVLVTFADQIVVSATSFITGVIIARSCTTDEFGLYSLAFSIGIFITTVQDSLITLPYTVFRPRLEGQPAKLYNGSVLVHQVGLSLTAVVLIGTGAIFYHEFSGLDRALQGLAIGIAPVLFREYLRRIDFANMSMTTVFWLDSLIALLQIGGLLLFCYNAALDVIRVYWVVGLACGLISLYWLIRHRADFLMDAKRVWLDLLHNWSFGRWVLAANIVSLMSSQLYLWFLSGLRGVAEVGILAACQGVIFLSNPFLIGARNILGPKLSHIYASQGVDGLQNTVRKVTALLGLLMGLFCFVAVFFGNRVIVAMYGAKYADFGFVVAVLALGTWVYTAGMPFAYGLWAMDKSASNFKIDLITVGITLTLGLALVSTSGATGAAYGFLVSSSVSSIIRRSVFLRIVKTNRDRAFVGQLRSLTPKGSVTALMVGDGRSG